MPASCTACGHYGRPQRSRARPGRSQPKPPEPKPARAKPEPAQARPGRGGRTEAKAAEPRPAPTEPSPPRPSPNSRTNSLENWRQTSGHHRMVLESTYGTHKTIRVFRGRQAWASRRIARRSHASCRSRPATPTTPKPPTVRCRLPLEMAMRARRRCGPNYLNTVITKELRLYHAVYRRVEKTSTTPEEPPTV